jgi:S1-C subfamily serine protease
MKHVSPLIVAGLLLGVLSCGEQAWAESQLESLSARSAGDTPTASACAESATAASSVEKPVSPASPSAPTATPPPATPGAAPVADDPLVATAMAMMSAGRFLSAEVFAGQKQKPQAGPVKLVPSATAPLPGREIARRAAAGYLRAGWFFQCTKCGRWHVNLAGGYAVATDTAVTAHHVMQPPENMKPGVGYPILVRGDLDVFPVAGVIADDATMDAIVLRAGVNDLKPLPLGGDVQVGDSVWCFSDPRGERNYFSTGIVNRFVTHAPGDVRQQRINVSTDWAPGSSGAAVLDAAGNVIGHVATIRALFSKPPTHAPDAKPGEPAAAGNPATAMNLHEAIPAKSVLTLIPH